MAFPMRPRAIPQCSACLRSYTWVGLTGSSSPLTNGLQHQIRGKKKLADNSGQATARLLKDVPGFGKKGAIVPVPRGMMRNNFFPTRVADYVTMPEMRQLKANNVPIERDYSFGKREESQPSNEPLLMPVRDEPTPAPVRKAPEVEKLTAERSMELLDIFVPHRMDFYRQPILEEKTEEPEPEQPKREVKTQRTASSAASDLLAARSQPIPKKPQPKTTGGIYGSVSTHDILVAVRASIARNDEAARVILGEQDIMFLDAVAREEGKIKLVGDFTVELKLKGVEEGIRRTVRVIPQDV